MPSGLHGEKYRIKLISGELPCACLVCWSHHNKRTTNWVASTRDIYCLTILEDGSPRSGCRHGWFPLKTLGVILLPASLPAGAGLLSLCGIPWPVDNPRDLAPGPFLLLWSPQLQIFDSDPCLGHRISFSRPPTSLLQGCMWLYWAHPNNPG